MVRLDDLLLDGETASRWALPQIQELRLIKRLVLKDDLSGDESKLNLQGTAGFSPCFHLPGFYFGYQFLTHTHLRAKRSGGLRLS